jgi:hypothetical protein
MCSAWSSMSRAKRLADPWALVVSVPVCQLGWERTTHPTPRGGDRHTLVGTPTTGGLSHGAQKLWYTFFNTQHQP